MQVLLTTLIVIVAAVAAVWLLLPVSAQLRLLQAVQRRVTRMIENRQRGGGSGCAGCSSQSDHRPP